MRRLDAGSRELRAWFESEFPHASFASLHALLRKGSILSAFASSQSGVPEEDRLESPAVEVLRHDYFGRGLRTRKQRAGVTFRLGQLVRDLETGDLAVIIGWDEEGVVSSVCVCVCVCVCV